MAKGKEIKSNLEHEYLRKLYNRYRALLDILDDAMHCSKILYPEPNGGSLGSDVIEYAVRNHIEYIERIEYCLQKAADTITEGINKHECKIAQDAKITIATTYLLNNRIKIRMLKLKETYLAEQEKEFWSGDEDYWRSLNFSAYRLHEQHRLIEQFIKDLLITETRILLELKRTKIRQLKRKEAELIVKRLLKDYPENDWNPRKISEYLLDVNLKYSHVSIYKLESWKKWDKENPKRKPSIVALTHLSQKSIDSEGKTHFSRKKNASNFSADND